MASWRVTRQDDNGNVYVVADGLDEAGARSLAAELEARAHKQLYAAERAPGDEPAADPIRGAGARG